AETIEDLGQLLRVLERLAARLRRLPRQDKRRRRPSTGGKRRGAKGRVAPGDCSPGGPADPYLHFRAYGSSYHELATKRLPELISAPSRTRRRDRCCFVSTVLGFDAPAMFPSNGVMTWRPLLSTGSLGMVPPLQRYYGAVPK